MKDNKDVSERKLIDRFVPDETWGGMKGIVTTTFDFAADWMETDFLPSLFNLGAWAEKNWTTRVALERRLSELDCSVVIAEARRYKSRPRSLRLNLIPALSSGGSVLHAKVSLMRFEKAVRLIVGSANLTKQGYRENREAIAVFTATEKSIKDAPAIFQGLRGMEAALDPWLTPPARDLIQKSMDNLRAWIKSESSDADTRFVWSNAQTRLWREFTGCWPVGEAIKRISIVSPFWSKDATSTVFALLNELKKTASFAADANVRFLTDAYEGSDGVILPVLPPEYALQDWHPLGVTATAQAVSAKVSAEEIGGKEDFTGRRSLHAKVVLVEGVKTGIAYIGSANFTGHGWGFLSSDATVNTEAGVILRRSSKDRLFEDMIPELAGDSVDLSKAKTEALRRPEESPTDPPWPGFIRQITLKACEGRTEHWQLVIDTDAFATKKGWQAMLQEKEGEPLEILVPIEHTQGATGTSFSIPLASPVLVRLLNEQQVVITWSEYLEGRSFPINVDAAMRDYLPVAPGKLTVEEDQLVAYYQGRIEWEEIFPDPDEPIGEEPPDTGKVSGTRPPDSEVDKSRIQSYQIREFVEALTGLVQDLRACAKSKACIRLALLGPVSPVALAQSIVDAEKAGKRTPMAAAFQLVEILGCFETVSKNTIPENLAQDWEQYFHEAKGKVSALLDDLMTRNVEALGANKTFNKYRTMALNHGRKGQS